MIKDISKQPQNVTWGDKSDTLCYAESEPEGTETFPFGVLYIPF